MIRKPSRKILVSVPAISFKNASTLQQMIDKQWLTFNRFTPETRNLSSFSSELTEFPKNSVFVNVPGVPLEKNGLRGVAGPGLPKEELFVPEALAPRLEHVAGQYDKWRPYPAEKPLTPYAIQMANRITKKRCKLLKELYDKQAWEFIFYVEHSTASLAHLDELEAILVCETVVEAALKASRTWSSCPLVIFSPYGPKNQSGFLASNILFESQENSNWDTIRSYINGRTD